MLIPDAFNILSQANLKIASLGSDIIDQEGTPRQPTTIRQLVRTRQLFNILNKFIFLNTGGTAISYTFGQNDAALNRLLLQLKRAAKITTFPVLPNPIQTFVSTYQNSGSIIIDVNNNISGVNNISITGSLSVIQNVSISGSLTLSTALSITSGGTGLNTIGAANTILGVNNTGTGLEYKTVSNGLTSSSTSLVLGGILINNTTLTGNGAVGDFTVIRTNTGKTNTFNISNGGISLFSSHATQNEINIYTTNGAGINSIIDLVNTGITIDTPRIEIIGSAINVSTGGSITTRNYVLGAKTFSGKQTFPASLTTSASLNILLGVAPTTGISDGDVWRDLNHLYARLNGVTYQLDQLISGLTAGKIPKALSASSIGDSIISDSGSAIAIAGTLSATSISSTLGISSGTTMSVGSTLTVAGFALLPIGFRMSVGGPDFKFKVIDIGNWNMVTTTYMQVAHGLNATDYSNIVSCKVMIYIDGYTTGGSISAGTANGGSIFDLCRPHADAASGNTIDGGIDGIDTTNVNLFRSSASTIFTNAVFSSGANRGRILICYK